VVNAPGSRLSTWARMRAKDAIYKERGLPLLYSPFVRYRDTTVSQPAEAVNVTRVGIALSG
jgi:hypothetical protein